MFIWILQTPLTKAFGFWNIPKNISHLELEFNWTSLVCHMNDAFEFYATGKTWERERERRK
jgi:hypothetical protein